MDALVPEENESAGAANEQSRRIAELLLVASVLLLVASEFSKYLDTALSEYDIAFSRYLGSLSSGYLEMFSAFYHAVLCVYRELCSNQGDCMNGICSFNHNYEGRKNYT
ncbi:hypothetical protein PsorP6_017329 [Peronosclerospora sorghi]|uniref:Uncharacterized protein n=1 Tax=Peronosclerospora sorghi TaxID=230839 RepID=A0ACC0WLB6_9STRA|nr:hypothetical protein PsorP6_017329 [Peronosclerospora sorghi]